MALTPVQAAAIRVAQAIMHPLIIDIANRTPTPTEDALLEALDATADFSKLALEQKKADS